ncbi:MAG TPA: ABC transporter ATP-binding protein [Jiangellaceae bacterium]
MTGTVLDVHSVTHTYTLRHAAAVTALHDVDLVAERGELVCVSGPSGSGKSTLCHLAAGLERPLRGTVRVSGHAPDRLRDWRMVAVAPQRHGLIPDLSVAENVWLPVHYGAGYASEGEVYGDGAVAAALELLDIAHIEGRMARQTSLGEQQRTAVARAIVLRPSLVVLDEPTSHQDDEHVDQVLEAFLAVREHGTALLVASHDERVMDVADRTVRLDEGRVVS